MRTEKVVTFTGRELADLACASAGITGRCWVEVIAKAGARDLNQVTMRISYED